MRQLGTGSALPAKRLTNQQLTQIVDTSDEWIVSRTGIEERRLISDETLLELATQASNRALEDAGVEAKDLDLIVCSSVLNEFRTPALACLIQEQIGATCPAFDMNAACPGFEYALDVADSYIASGKCKKVLVVCAELLSQMVNWDDRATCVLFGDGAGAAVVGDGQGFLSIKIKTMGGKELLNAEIPKRETPYFKPGEAQTGGLYMNGPEVYKFAVSNAVKDIKEVLEDAGESIEDVKFFVLHQANIRILEAVRNRLKQPVEKFPYVIQKYGNTSSASIPILLDELNKSGQLEKGDLVVLSAFGAGLTTGACLLRWG